MKKILLLMALVLPLTLISCGDDKDEPSSLEQQLIGSWTGTDNSATSSVLKTKVISYTFNSNHTGQYTWEEIPNITGGKITRGGYNFKWKLKKNVLHITRDGSDGDATYEISIENGVLKMKSGGGGIIQDEYKLQRVQE